MFQIRANRSNAEFHVLHRIILIIDACIIAENEWRSSSWRNDQADAMQDHNWEKITWSVSFNSTTYNQESIPILAVNATLLEHVRATMPSSVTHNLRLVIKLIDMTIQVNLQRVRL